MTLIQLPSQMARRPAPTGSPTERRRRPHLLALVFGVFLALLGVTTAAQAVLITVHFSATALDAAAGRDRSLVRLIVLPELRTTDLDPSAVTPERRGALRARLADIASRDDVQTLAVVAPDGTVVVSTDAALDGVSVGASAPWSTAAAGQVGSEIRSSESDGGTPPAEPTGSAGPSATTLVEYFPLTTPGGGVDGVVIVERPAAPILARLEETRRDILLVTVGAAGFLALLLVWIFRAAHVRLLRQTAQLIEAERRDALTGLYTHGTAIGLLATELETLSEERRRDTPGLDAPTGPPAADLAPTACLALLDIDNFRLLNDTNGHDVGSPLPSVSPRPSVSPLPSVAASPLPSRAPSPSPLPSRTPAPSPSSSPAASLPARSSPGTSLLPSPSLPSTASPTPSASAGAGLPSASPSPGVSASPGASASASLEPSPSPSSSDGASLPPSGGGIVGSTPGGSGSGGSGPGGTGGGDQPAIGLAGGDTLEPISDSTGVGLQALGMLDGGREWLVPLFVVSIPGFLVILAILGQSIVGLIWLIPVRRSLGTTDRPTRAVSRERRP